MPTEVTCDTSSYLTDDWNKMNTTSISVTNSTLSNSNSSQLNSTSIELSETVTPTSLPTERISHHPTTLSANWNDTGMNVTHIPTSVPTYAVTNSSQLNGSSSALTSYQPTTLSTNEMNATYIPTIIPTNDVMNSTQLNGSTITPSLLTTLIPSRNESFNLKITHPTESPTYSSHVPTVVNNIETSSNHPISSHSPTLLSIHNQTVLSSQPTNKTLDFIFVGSFLLALIFLIFCIDFHRRRRIKANRSSTELSEVSQRLQGTESESEWNALPLDSVNQAFEEVRKKREASSGNILVQNVQNRRFGKGVSTDHSLKGKLNSSGNSDDYWDQETYSPFLNSDARN